MVAAFGDRVVAAFGDSLFLGWFGCSCLAVVAVAVVFVRSSHGFLGVETGAFSIFLQGVSTQR